MIRGSIFVVVAVIGGAVASDDGLQFLAVLGAIGLAFLSGIDVGRDFPREESRND